MSIADFAVGKAPVGARTVQQRINHKLAPDHKAIRSCRSDLPGWRNLGDYYLLNFQQNHVIDTHVNLESMARELGVLAEWETVVDDLRPTCHFRRL